MKRVAGQGVAERAETWPASGKNRCQDAIHAIELTCRAQCPSGIRVPVPA